MAASASTAGATQRSLPCAPAAVRFLIAALAGGSALLLWGGTAGAAETEAPAPATSAADAGLLGGLLGDGGAVAPVVDLVDTATGTLVGGAPVGATVDQVVETVDPIAAPVAAPVTDAARPLIDPVAGTLGTITETAVAPVQAAVPTGSGAPIVPTIPPVIDPAGPLLPELPPLLPPDPTAVPGAAPGTAPNPPTSLGPEAVGSGTSVPLAIAAGPDDRIGEADPISPLGTADATAAQRSGPGAEGAGGVAGDEPASDDASGTGTLPTPLAPEGSLPGPCSSPGRGTPAGGPAAFLGGSCAPGAGTAAPLDAVTSPPPASAPPAAPDVAPD